MYPCFWKNTLIKKIRVYQLVEVIDFHSLFINKELSHLLELELGKSSKEKLN